MPKKNKDNKLEKVNQLNVTSDYDSVLSGMVDLLEQARRTAARTVNAVMTATYWEMGRRIVRLNKMERNVQNTAKSYLKISPKI